MLVFNGKILKSIMLFICYIFSNFAHALEFELETIIVTANKRVENLQSIGISAQTLLGDELAKSGMYDLRSIGDYVPGLNIRSAEGEHNQIITLRGVGLRSATANVSPSVGVHTDGIYQATPAFLSFPLFDIERVEVLKGPQGTLYGKNTTGGTINIMTHQPTQERNGHAYLSYGRFNDLHLEAAVGGGLNDRLSGRFALMANYSDGHQRNQGTLGNDGFTRIPGTIPALPLTAANDDWGGANKLALRGSLHWAVSNAFRTTLSLHGLRDRSETWQRKLKGTDRLGFSDPSGDPRDVVTHLEPRIHLNQWGGFLNNEFDLNGIQFKALSGFEILDRDYITDDSSPTRLAEQFFDDRAYLFSQEFLLTSEPNRPLRWQAGVLYTHDSAEHDKTTRSFDIALSSINTQWTRRANAISIFGQTEYNVLSQLNVIAGVRYSYERRTFEARSVDVDPFALGLNLFPELPISTDDHINNDGISWKLGIDWQVDDDTLVYFSSSHGFKSGGWDGSPFITASATLPFDEETVLSHELGFKTDWQALDLRLNGAAFYTDYDNLQDESTLFIPTGLGLIPDNRIINVGTARIVGLELDLLWLTPIEGLSLKGDVAFMHSEITEFTPGEDRLDFTGNALPGTPELELFSRAAYAWSIDHYTANVSIDYRYTTKVFHDLNNNEALVSDRVGLFDARLELSGRQFTMGAWIRNITDENYTTSNFFGGFGGVTQLHGLPRRYGLDFWYDF